MARAGRRMVTGRTIPVLCSAALVASMLQPAAAFGVSAPAFWRAAQGLPAHGTHAIALGAGRRRAPRAGAADLKSASAPGEDPAMRKNPALYSETRPGAAAPSVAPAKTTGSVFKSAGGRPAQQRATQMVKPEVLAPAGGWPQLRAAVQNGADACYFGLSDFNARARASNFDPVEDLPAVMEYLHEHGVKGYVTINVLIFDTELEDLERMVKQVARCGVDAVIVQDIGAVHLIKAIAPNLRIHGSTQMSITSTEGARFAQALGVSRVVLGRELSVREITAVREGFGHEIEVFVHGALCVSYSGQCFSSEAWGGRSANRGQCAQACWLPYKLVLNGEEREMDDIKYLLSPQDLMAVELVPDLIAAGVTCFKIEGRLKGPEYVALTTQVYRQAVDRAWVAMENSPDAIPAALKDTPFLTREVELELAQVFARGQDSEHSGLTPGFLEGSQHQRLVRGRSPRHRGVLVGTVERVLPGEAGVVVALAGVPIKRGDGVVFDRGEPELREEGGHVYELLDSRGRSVAATKADEVSRGSYTLTFGRRAVDARMIAPGDLVWKNRDAALDKKLEALITRTDSQGAAMHNSGVSITVSGVVGEPLRMRLLDSKGNSAEACSANVLQAAQKKAVDEAAVRKAIGLLGGTGLQVESVDVTGMATDAFLPLGDIKETRRKAVQQLLDARVQRPAARRAHGVTDDAVLPRVRAELRGEDGAAVGVEAAPAWSEGGGDKRSRQVQRQSEWVRRGKEEARVTILCRSRAQVEAALEVQWLEEVILDFLEVQGLQEAVTAVRAAGKHVVVATPRVLKPEEDRMWRFYVKIGADALLVRSAGMLQQLLDLGGPHTEVEGAGTIPELYGDFSLNVANELAARQLLRDCKLSRLAPTHDLNAYQMQVCACDDVMM